MNTEGKKAQQKEVEKCWSQNYAWKRTANTFVVTDFFCYTLQTIAFYFCALPHIPLWK